MRDIPPTTFFAGIRLLSQLSTNRFRLNSSWHVWDQTAKKEKIKMYPGGYPGGPKFDQFEFLSRFLNKKVLRIV